MNEYNKDSKTLSPVTVKLSGVLSFISHGDLNNAVEKFGKTKSVVLIRSSLQAVVVFEQKEGAEKLRKAKSIKVKGHTIHVLKESSTDVKKPSTTKTQKTAPPQKHAKSDVSTSKTTKSTSSEKVKTLLTSSGAKNTTSGKLVTKAKILVSKAKGISRKQVAKTVTTSNENKRKELATAPKSKSSQEKPDGPKPKAVSTKSESKTNKSKVAPEDAAKAKEQANTAVAKTKKLVQEEKNSTSKAETSSTTLKVKTQPGQVTGLKAVEQEACAKDKNLPSGSVISKNHNATEKTEKVSALGPKDETKVTTTGATASGQKELVEVVGLVESVSKGDSEQLKLETEGTEPMVVESSAESKDQKLTDTKTSPAKLTDGHPETSAVKTSPRMSPPKPSTDSLQGPQTTFQTNKTSVKASPVQTSPKADSESPAEELKTKKGTLEKQQEAVKQEGL
ncbi:nucleolar protein dao-5-like [Nematolebias whitei]|uniref:nucleolar protein dao-5-like n=1 Tax=Nematolebias whitei TaxID=451745 RepID=UPI0018986211|nr:nucleolar protein dao-5-like [Nematolebias whitei]